MTTGELIKVLADYCPDTPVEVVNLTTNVEGAGGMYTTYNDSTETLEVKWVTPKDNT